MGGRDGKGWEIVVLAVGGKKKNALKVFYPIRVHASPPSCNHGDGQTIRIKFIPFVCLSQVHASPPTPPASATIVQSW